MSKGKALVWLISVLIIVAILAVGGWFVYAKYYANKIEVSENQENIGIRKGQEFTINFISNASTGYSWKVDESYDKNIVNLVGHEYKSSNSGMVGAAGEELWTFKGVNRGNTKLNFSYVRPWESSKQPLNIKNFNITVK